MENPRRDFDTEVRRIKEDIDRLKSGHTDLEAKHLEIRSVMVGDMSGKPGVMQQLVNLMNEIYDPTQGIKRRVDDWEKIKWKFAGGWLVVSAIGTFAFVAAWELFKLSKATK